jgi:hypothetical protein
MYMYDLYICMYMHMLYMYMYIYMRCSSYCYIRVFGLSPAVDETDAGMWHGRRR